LDLTNVSVVTGYKAEHFDKYDVYKIYNNDFYKTNIFYSFLLGLKSLNDNDDGLFLYSDIIYSSKVLKTILDSKFDFNLPVLSNWYSLWKKRFKDPLIDLETCKIKSNNVLSEIGKKTFNYEEIQGQYMGIFFIKKSLINKLKHIFFKKDENNLLNFELDKVDMTFVINFLVKQGFEIHTIPIKGGWFEFDKQSDVRLFQEYIVDSNVQEQYPWE